MENYKLLYTDEYLTEKKTKKDAWHSGLHLDPGPSSKVICAFYDRKESTSRFFLTTYKDFIQDNRDAYISISKHSADGLTKLLPAYFERGDDWSMYIIPDQTLVKIKWSNREIIYGLHDSINWRGREDKINKGTNGLMKIYRENLRYSNHFIGLDFRFWRVPRKLKRALYGNSYGERLGRDIALIKNSTDLCYVYTIWHSQSGKNPFMIRQIKGTKFPIAGTHNWTPQEWKEANNFQCGRPGTHTYHTTEDIKVWADGQYIDLLYKKDFIFKLVNAQCGL